MDTSKPMPIVGIVGPREPYEKPSAQMVDVGNLMDVLEQQEGELYREFNNLAEEIDAIVANVEAFEARLTRASERLDKLKLDLAKLQFAIEAQAVPSA